MKYGALFVFIMLSMSVNSFAQTSTEEKKNEIMNLYPNTKFGVIAGYSFNKFITNNKSFENIEFDREKFPTAGLFIEYPIPKSILALRVEALFMKQAYSYHGDVLYKTSYSNYNPPFNYYKYLDEKDLLIDLNTVCVPLIMRISDCSRKTGMFVDLGLIFNFNIRNEWHIYKTDERNGGIYIDELIDGNLNADALVGYSLGFGVYHYFGKQRVYIEARTGRSTPLTDGDFNLSQNHVIAGFSF